MNFIAWTILLLVQQASASTESLSFSGSAIVGEPAPWLSGWTLEDKVFNINKPFEDESVDRLVLVFWATWCKPCRKGIAQLTANQPELEEAGIRIVLINLGEKEDKVREYLEDNPQPYTVVLDPFEKSVDTYLDIHGTATLPKTVLIRPDGVVEAIFGSEDEDYVQRIIDGK